MLEIKKYLKSLHEQKYYLVLSREYKTTERRDTENNALSSFAAKVQPAKPTQTVECVSAIVMDNANRSD